MSFSDEMVKAVRSAIVGARDQSTNVNPLWVSLMHRDTEKLVSRKAWVDRWRMDRLGNSPVRSMRKNIMATTKVCK